MSGYTSSGEDNSREENLPHNRPASNESPEPMEVDADELKPVDLMIHSKSPGHELRNRETASGESMADEDDNDDDNDDVDESKGTHDGSFNNPLASIDKSIHIGTEHQAVMELKETGNEAEREQKVWECPDKMDDIRLDEYVAEASGRYRIPVDRCLYILQKENYRFERALIECSKRREIRDEWSAEEKKLFTACFYHFGKQFKKIHAVMPQRSILSIVQHYYDSKKSQNYQISIHAHLNEKYRHDELFHVLTNFKKAQVGTCENCKKDSDVLILNRVMARHECKPCILYFRLMRAPRPASLQMTGKRDRPLCPEYMRQYVDGYEEMMEPADGKAVERLGIGKQKEADNDDCMVLDDCPLRQPSAPYIVNSAEDDDPVDMNTCRMTRCFDTPDALALIDNIRKKHHMSLPLVWRQNQTKCMEDIEILNEEARQKMVNATDSYINVKNADINKWKEEMAQLKEQLASLSPEPEVPQHGSENRSGRVRTETNWSQQEKQDVVRCFHWYDTNFGLISEVMGTKTAGQIKQFYEANEEVISQSIQKYKNVLRAKMSNNK